MIKKFQQYMISQTLSLFWGHVVDYFQGFPKSIGHIQQNLQEISLQIR